MRKILVIFAIFIIFLLPFQMIKPALASEDINDVISIENVEDFLAIKNDLSANYKLTANINFAKVSNYISIGDALSPFSGSLDGNNYSILNFSLFSENSYAGLFGVISNADIKNLKLINVHVESTSEYAGVLAGKIENSTVENIELYSASVACFNAAIFCGVANNSSFKNISITGDAFSYNNSALFSVEAIDSTFENCYAISSISIPSSFYNKVSNSTFTDCYYFSNNNLFISSSNIFLQTSTLNFENSENWETYSLINNGMPFLKGTTPPLNFPSPEEITSSLPSPETVNDLDFLADSEAYSKLISLGYLNYQEVLTKLNELEEIVNDANAAYSSFMNYILPENYLKFNFEVAISAAETLTIYLNNLNSENKTLAEEKIDFLNSLILNQNAFLNFSSIEISKAENLDLSNLASNLILFSKNFAGADLLEINSLIANVYNEINLRISALTFSLDSLTVDDISNLELSLAGILEISKLAFFEDLKTFEASLSDKITNLKTAKDKYENLNIILNTLKTNTITNFNLELFENAKTLFLELDESLFNDFGKISALYSQVLEMHSLFETYSTLMSEILNALKITKQSEINFALETISKITALKLSPLLTTAERNSLLDYKNAISAKINSILNANLEEPDEIEPGNPSQIAPNFERNNNFGATKSRLTEIIVVLVITFVLFIDFKRIKFKKSIDKNEILK